MKVTEISERAEQIQKNLGKLSKSLEEVEDSWSTLYTHIKNAYNKAGEVNFTIFHFQEDFSSRNIKK